MTELSHYGVKGMKWGVRKNDSGSGKLFIKKRTESISAKLKNGDTLLLDGDKTPALGKFISKMSPAFRERVNNSFNYTLRGPDGKAVGEMSLKKESPTSINVVWVGVDESQRGKGYASVAMQSAVDFARKNKMDTVTLEVPGKSPDARHIYEKMGFREDPSKSEPWDPVWGGLTAMELNLNAKHGELAHYGVKGMKWGVRKARPGGVSRKTDRMARKDAKEFARAKQFYGEGAGTRRKLIKARVEGISKKNPGYKKAFEAHLANQDTSKHASKAQSERKRKDVKKSVGRGIRGTRHILSGNSQYASAATAIAVGGALYAHKAGIDKTILNTGKKAYAKAKDPKGHQAARNLLKNMGIG
jgi:ribosomal protein S18 acetylase RimI-like enzyme